MVKKNRHDYFWATFGRFIVQLRLRFICFKSRHILALSSTLGPVVFVPAIDSKIASHRFYADTVDMFIDVWIDMWMDVWMDI